MSTCFAVSYVPCGCKAHLDAKDPRAEIWMKVFGCLSFPLKHPISHMAITKGESSARYLQGDWRALSDEEKLRMVAEMKEKFGVSQEVFMSQIRAVGYVPIKDENITITCCQLHSRMMMSP